jgi:hypothetical protein
MAIPRTTSLMVNEHTCNKGHTYITADLPQPRPIRPSGKISDRSTVLCGKPVITNVDRSAVASVGSFESA